MKKFVRDYQERAIKNLSSVRGGDGGSIDRDKIKVPPNGTKK